MNYEIIRDENLLKDFISWLPELRADEKYYLHLLARSKYEKNKDLLKKDKLCLKRIITDKKFMFRKIWQLETPIGSYDIDGQIVPQTSLALYISPNPRSMLKASKNLLKVLADKITEDYDGYNPSALSLTAIQKTCSRRIFGDFDFDVIDDKVSDTLQKIKQIINPECLTLVKTRGGFHALVEYGKMDSQYSRSFHNGFKSIEGCDVVEPENSLIPCLGTVQSEFIPHFLSL